MRNANKSAKNVLFCSDEGSGKEKQNSILPISPPNHGTKSQLSRPITFAVILLTDKQTHKQNRRKHNLPNFVGVSNEMYKDRQCIRS